MFIKLTSANSDVPDNMMINIKHIESIERNRDGERTNLYLASSVNQAYYVKERPEEIMQQIKEMQNGRTG